MRSINSIVTPHIFNWVPWAFWVDHPPFWYQTSQLLYSSEGGGGGEWVSLCINGVDFCICSTKTCTHPVSVSSYHHHGRSSVVPSLSTHNWIQVPLFDVVVAAPIYMYECVVVQVNLSPLFNSNWMFNTEKSSILVLTLHTWIIYHPEKIIYMIEREALNHALWTDGPCVQEGGWTIIHYEKRGGGYLKLIDSNEWTIFS